MALNQTNRLVWIARTIIQARKISFEDLNQKWLDDDISNGKPLLKRTFHKWAEKILISFGLIIECEKCAPYRYYISNESELRNGSIENWLLKIYSISNSLANCKSIKDRIILEDIPSGREYLEPILDAMKKNRFIHLLYYRYWCGDTRGHYVMPLCLKLFRQRWYVVGREWTSGIDMLLCLDRIRDFRLSSHTFKYPKDFDPQAFFEDCFGIIADKKCKAEDVYLKVSAGQANYMRDLPMMESQQELERNGEYSIFKLHVRPTYDFQQELLWNMEEVEVLKPLWLRKQIAGIIKRMWNKYNKEERQ